jgi:hypothetical protein
MRVQLGETNSQLTKVVKMTQHILDAIENWFTAQCDGDWEHSYGLSIESTDNPGWYVEIDLAATALADVEVPFSRNERSESDWMQFEIREGKFTASGGVRNLAEILLKFLALTRS